MFRFILLVIPFLLVANTDKALQIKKLEELKKETKVALIIGNSNYKKFSKLKNAVNDSRSLKNILDKKGFDVIYIENASRSEIKKSMRKFHNKIKQSHGVGFFYYSGHGLQVDGENYLVPVNADIHDKTEVEDESVALNTLINKMENARNRLNIIVMDACRNDPFSRSGAGGLAAIDAAKGMYIAYATAPGDVASDGRGSNSPFAKHLINELNKPVQIEQVFKNVRVGVMNETDGKQIPWSSSSITGDFYFTVPDGSVVAEPKRETYLKPQKQSSFSFESNKPSTFSLTINTIPSNAKVAITNIGPKYFDGIKLKQGKYNIKVSKNGYYTKTGEVDLYSDLSININLDRKPVEPNNIKDKYGNIYREVTSPYTGRVWLDRNLGAKRVCKYYNDEQCYGDYFQWGRDADGHEKKNSLTTSSLSNSDIPNHGKFILSNKDNRKDWLKNQNDSLWQGAYGLNNPCPKAFRVPTIDELQNETINQSVLNHIDAFKTFLKIPSNKIRCDDGKLCGNSKEASLWSSTVSGKKSNTFYVLEDKVIRNDSTNRQAGLHIRCIKD